MDYVKIIKAMLLNSSATISEILSIRLKCFFFKENLRKNKEQNNHDKTRHPYFSKGHIQF
jgi:hypothetical protein